VCGQVGVRWGMAGCVASCTGEEVLQASSVLLHRVARAARGGEACSQPRPQALLRQWLLYVCACATPAAEACMRRDGCEGGAWDGQQSEGGQADRAYALLAHSALGADACALACGRACMRAHECVHARTPHHQLRGGCAGQFRHSHITQWHRQAGQGVVVWGVGWTQRAGLLGRAGARAWVRVGGAGRALAGAGCGRWLLQTVCGYCACLQNAATLRTGCFHGSQHTLLEPPPP